MENKMECLNQNYSTTRQCYKLIDDKFLDKNKKIKDEYKFKLNFPEQDIINSKILAKDNEKFDTYLFLPEGDGRKGEGGLRTKGYFKNSLKNKPLISIITVVFNGEKYLEETIQSVINQTYDNVEYIIIDGGSTDRTLDIIKKYDDYVDYWISEKDTGIYDAMNKGIDLATGKWINFMNAGDNFYDFKVLEKIFKNKFLSECKVLYGNTMIKYSGSLTIEKKVDKLNFNIGLPFCHQSIFVKTELHKKMKFLTRYKIYADLVFFTNLFYNENIKFNYIDTSISQFDYSGISSLKTFAHYKELYSIKNEINGQISILYFFNSFLKELVKKILPCKIVNLIRNIKGK